MLRLLSLLLLAAPCGAATWTASGAGALLQARYEHTATLLPDGRLLVAGGRSGTTAFAAAELYDPRTGTWTAAASMPQARYGHTATLLENGLVLVAGGYTGSAYLATAALYNPAANTWAPTGSMPQSRYHAAAVLLYDGRAVVTGGFNGGTLASTHIYNPNTGAWTTGPAMPAPGRSGHTMTMLLDGRALVAGGSANGVRTNTARIFNPAGAGSWTTTGSMTGPRYRHTATLLRDGTVLVAGGANPSALATVQRYNPNTGTWTAGPDMAARQLHTATLMPDGSVVVTGGAGAAGRVATTQRWDPVTNVWTSLNNLTQPRSEHTATLLADGRLLVAAGNTATASATGTSNALKPNMAAWFQSGNMTLNRMGHTAVLLGSGRVLVAGGHHFFGPPDSGEELSRFLSETELFDPASETWAAAGSMISSRTWHTATVLADGKVLAAGGFNGGPSNGAEVYDPAAGGWSSAAPMLQARYNHAATLLTNGRVLVTGGASTTAGMSGVEVFDPSSGTWTPAASMAVPRSRHSAVLLPDGRVLVAGGLTDNALSGNVVTASAQVWNPATGLWSPAGSLNHGRESHSAALLPGGRVIVAGGFGDGQSFVTTAEIWDPATNAWTLTSSPTHPRALSAAVTLPDGRLLLVGGAGLRRDSEVYEEAGSSWTVTGPLAATDRYSLTATLLPDLRILIAGGGSSVLERPIESSELARFTEYDYRRAPLSPAQPQLSSVSTLTPGTPATITGSGLTGVAQSDQGHLSRVTLRGHDTGDPVRTAQAVVTQYDGSQLQFIVPSGLRPGPYQLWVQAAGVPSDSRTVVLPGPATVTPPAPALTAIRPSSASAGSPGFTLTVNGPNLAGGTVRWNGTDRPTAQVSASTLTASISQGDVAAVGTATVTVFTSSLSNGLPFQVLAAPSTGQPLVVSLTFDDGSADHAQVGQLLVQRGFRGTFFVNSAFLGSSGFYMTQAQVGALHAAGHEIGGHTLHHVDLSTVSASEAQTEICGDRTNLSAYDPVTFAYPYGHFNSSVKSLTSGCGWPQARAAFGLGSGAQPDAEGNPPPDRYAIRTPEAVRAGTTTAMLQQIVLDAEAVGGWLPLQFHRMCDGCSDFGVSSPTLVAFLDWLRNRPSSTVVRRMRDVLGGGSGVLFADDFTYPNGPVPPGKWDVTAGQFLANDNQGWTGLNPAIFKALSAPTGVGAEVSARVNVVGFTGSPGSGLDAAHIHLRHQDPNNFYMMSVRRRDGRTSLKKRQAGVWTTYSTPLNGPSLGSFIDVRAVTRTQSNGTVALELYGNGTLLAQAVDGSNPILSAGRAGLASENAEFRVDDFTAGGSTAPVAATMAVTEAIVEAGEPDSAFGLRDVYAFPNPSRRGQGVTIRLQTGLADAGSIRIFDLSGRLVHSGTLGSPSVVDGRYTYDYRWDAGGAGSGVYLYRVTAERSGHPAVGKTGKVAVIK